MTTTATTIANDRLSNDGATWWYVTASNAQARYGYGTQSEAAQWVARLNGDATHNLLAAYLVTDDDWDMCETGDIGCTIADEIAE